MACWAASCSCGTMVRAPLGQTLAQLVQPMQSSGLMAMVNLRTGVLRHLDLERAHALGRVSDLVLGEAERTDGGVRADIGALVALDALVGVPMRNHDGDAALLEGGSAGDDWPSSWPTNADTGRESPSMSSMGSMMALTCLAMTLALLVGEDGLVGGVGPVSGGPRPSCRRWHRRRWRDGWPRRCPYPSWSRTWWQRPSCTGWRPRRGAPWPARRTRTAARCWCACPLPT